MESGIIYDRPLQNPLEFRSLFTNGKKIIFNYDLDDCDERVNSNVARRLYVKKPVTGETYIKCQYDIVRSVRIRKTCSSFHYENLKMGKHKETIYFQVPEAFKNSDGTLRKELFDDNSCLIHNDETEKYFNSWTYYQSRCCHFNQYHDTDFDDHDNDFDVSFDGQSCDKCLYIRDVYMFKKIKIVTKD